MANAFVIEMVMSFGGYGVARPAATRAMDTEPLESTSNVIQKQKQNAQSLVGQ